MYRLLEDIEKRMSEFALYDRWTAWSESMFVTPGHKVLIIRRPKKKNSERYQEMYKHRRQPDKIIRRE